MKMESITEFVGTMILRILLIGGIMVLLLFGGCLFLLYLDGRPRIKPVSKEAAIFVLDACKLGGNRIEEVVHSYDSRGGFHGDGTLAHAIRVSHLDVSGLVYDETSRSGWYRGDALSEILQDKIYFFSGHQYEVPCLSILPPTGVTLQDLHKMSWFPTIGKVRSSEMYVYVDTFIHEGKYVYGYGPVIIIANPKTRMVYYLEVRT